MTSLIDQLVQHRPYIPFKRPEIYNGAYRPLITKCYKRTRPRKVFKTRSENNPVYDIQYSPVIYNDHRVMAVGDEHGFLNILKVKLDDGKKTIMKKKSNRLDAYNQQGQMTGLDFNSVHATSISSLSARVGPVSSDTEDQMELQVIQPVLYSVAWNSDGSKVLAGYGDGSLRIWDLSKDPPSCTFCALSYNKSIKRVAWGDNDSTMISCSRTNEICVHDDRMRRPLANKINCAQLNSKLTDISVIYPYVLSCSSNQSQISLWDVRKTYKLYKKINPVETFDLKSPGYTNMAFDATVNEKLFALGSDSKVRSLNWRTGKAEATYRVPGNVDFFSKIDVDCVSNLMVSGGSGSGAHLFDLAGAGAADEGTNVDPFWELNTNRRWQVDGEEGDDDGIIDKENDDKVVQRCCCAVALGNRRGVNDCFVQIATGGDDAIVTLWD